MIEFLVNNLGTILVAAVLLAIVTLIVTGITRKKKSGQCVTCDCGSCTDERRALCAAANSAGN